MARSRSTALIAIGAAVFVVGAALTLLAVGRGDDGKVRATTTPAADAAAQPAAAAVPQVAAAPVKIPEGKEAIALQLPKIAGLGGYTEVGDRVNVYGTFKDRQPGGSVKGAPLVKLILSNVEVLAVTSAAATTEGGSATYIFAVSPDEAEKLIYLSSYEGIWLSLVRDGAPPVEGTTGHNVQNVA